MMFRNKNRRHWYLVHYMVNISTGVTEIGLSDKIKGDSTFDQLYAVRSMISFDKGFDAEDVGIISFQYLGLLESSRRKKKESGVDHG